MSLKYLKSDQANFLNALGTEQAWGWSPAIDWTSLLPSQKIDNLLATANPGPNISTSPEIFCKSIPDSKLVSSNIIPIPVVKESKDALEAAFQELSLTDSHDDPDDAVKSHVKCLNSGAKASPPSSTEIPPTGSHAPQENDIHLLLCGACDIRHILSTLASLRLRQASQVINDDLSRSNLSTFNGTVHFFLYEPNLRLLCRHLFFLQLLLDSMFSLSELEDKVLMFLDIFGNINLRDASAMQMRDVTQRVLHSLRKRSGPLWDLLVLDDIKMKELDFLEQQLACWITEEVEINPTTDWNRRVESDLAERFDNHNNLFDWDFHFHVSDYFGLLKSEEYRTWRQSGIAFDVAHINPRRNFRYEQVVPNKTLCHFHAHRQPYRGYYAGDIKNGPFMAFGAATEGSVLWRRGADNKHVYGNGLVAMYNIRAWIYALLTGKPWVWEDHKFAWDDDKWFNWLPPDTPDDIAYRPVLPKVRFHLIGLNIARVLKHHKLSIPSEGISCISLPSTPSAQPHVDSVEQSKCSLSHESDLLLSDKLELDSIPLPISTKYPLFDGIFVSSLCTDLLTPSLFECCSNDGLVVVETLKSVSDFNDETKNRFADLMMQKAKNAKWELNSSKTEKLKTYIPPLKFSYEASSTGESPAQDLIKKRYNMPFHLVFSSSDSLYEEK